MQKIDHKKIFKHLYQPKAKDVVEIDVPAMNFLMIDGQGDPNTAQEYADAVGALYAVSYGLKFLVKKGGMNIDYKVMPLEGLWWTDNMADFSVADKSNWKWTSMMMQPDFVTAEMVADTLSQVTKKKNPPAISKMRFEPFKEGKCAQTLHIGPFSQEGPTIERVHSFIQENGELCGKHHEIYLSDIRRAAPEKWKTIIRQPMQ